MGLCNVYIGLESNIKVMFIESIKHTHIETGLNRNTITLLYKEIAQRIDLNTIDKLCALFDCEVEDF